MGLPVEVNNLMLGSLGGYTVGRSLRLRSSASAYLNRTPASSGNSQKFTLSAWLKLGATITNMGGLFCCSTNSNLNFRIYFQSNNLYINQYDNGTFVLNLTSTQVFRDPSAWYHIVIAFDTTQATSSNRAKVYVNGVQITAFSTANYPAQNYSFDWNKNSPHLVSSLYSGTNIETFFDGYLAEVYNIDGQALTPSSFGAYDTNGVWQPKKYSGTYGTNGFYLPFSNTTSTTTLVQDSSGNGNNWTPNNISLTAGATYDSMIDSPTNSANSSNYAVGNPLNADGSTWSSGNLNFSLPNGTGNSQATFAVSSGKWYWEVVYSAQPNYTGVQQTGLTTRFTNGVLYGSAGDKSVNGTTSAYGATYTNGDIIGVALDMDGSTVTFYKNNVSQGSISLSGVGITNATFSLSAGGGTTSTGSVNFGQRPFSYTPPTGFKALNTYNLPDSTIKNGNKFFDTSLFTGTSGNVTISGLGFQPDFVWLKARSNVQGHTLFDSVRGANKYLQSNLTNAEATMTNPPSFTSDGWVSTTDTHTNGYTYAAWQWKGGATAVTNNSGTISSQVSANTTSGFSIVTYTGNGSSSQTVGHGLGVAPSFVITKRRNTGATDWNCWFTGFANNDYIVLNSTGAKASDPNTFPSASGMTSSVFTIGNGAWINGSGNTYVAYCFSAVRGFSAFGSYVGNASSDGPFAYTGFRPKFIMIKNSSYAGTGWRMFDTSRSSYNVATERLWAHSSAAESTASAIDILSNGFKIRDASLADWFDYNKSGDTMIYMAFAENPFTLSRAR